MRGVGKCKKFSQEIIELYFKPLYRYSPMGGFVFWDCWIIEFDVKSLAYNLEVTNCDLKIDIFMEGMEMQVDLIRVERSIRLIRGDKVILDEDLAELYGVETKKLVQAVKRNSERFPADFMFQLTNQEFKDLKSQSAITSQWGGRRTPPYAFSEQGVAMLSSVLHSPRAVQVNIEIMRTFVRLRQMLASHADLAERLESLEQKYDEQFRSVFDAFRQLMSPDAVDKESIGFKVKEEAGAYQ
jgi:hypothetical protein